MLRFMTNKILIPLLVIGGLAAFFSFRYSGGDEQTNEERHALIQETIMKVIKEGHYSPRDLDDSFSARVFKKVLDEMDGEKIFFTQQDIDALSKYKYQIDDELNNGSVAFFDKLDAIYIKRVTDADSLCHRALKTPFTFTGNDSIETTGNKLTYAADDQALAARWRETMKLSVLMKYVDLQKDQEKKKENKDSVHAKLKTDAEMEVAARESVGKIETNYFKRLQNLKDNERFSVYMNAVTLSEDPHTEYFPPREKEMFDQAMSGSFVGIGAQLRQDGDKIKITAIITGSPSWKQGELKAGDEIMKVAQGDKPPVDVEGSDLEDVVQIIRGKKGTEVRLTVKKENGATKIIPIIRGEVLLEETFAKSAIIKSKDGPVGYIYLPEFYADFQHVNGRRCADDVAAEVKKLKAANVKGIILDLRNNGGGSLGDVVDMAGLFVGGGPVVQVKSSDAAPTTLSAHNTAPLYDGPMAVMVNQGSASASEIMAAALQDYKRAVVVGATTYGKGTVQKLVPLDELIDPVTRMKMADANGNSAVANNSSIGSLKITMQKFYRVDGGSTQLRGVTPDIHLPDPYELIDNGERSDIAALKWDEIPAANYTPTNNEGNVSQLAALSASRVAANPIFSEIKESAEEYKKRYDDNVYSLNDVKFRKEQEDVNNTSKKLEELQKKTNSLEFSNPKEDLARINADTTEITKNKDWIKALKKDIYISETVNIINDMEKQGIKMNVAGAVGKE